MDSREDIGDTEKAERELKELQRRLSLSGSYDETEKKSKRRQRKHGATSIHNTVPGSTPVHLGSSVSPSSGKRFSQRLKTQSSPNYDTSSGIYEEGSQWTRNLSQMIDTEPGSPRDGKSVFKLPKKGFFQKLLGGSKPKIVEKLHKTLKSIQDSPSSRENFKSLYTLLEEYDKENERCKNMYFEKAVQSLIDYTYTLLDTNRGYFILEYPFFGWLVLKLKSYDEMIHSESFWYKGHSDSWKKLEALFFDLVRDIFEGEDRDKNYHQFLESLKLHCPTFSIPDNNPNLQFFMELGFKRRDKVYGAEDLYLVLFAIHIEDYVLRFDYDNTYFPGLMDNIWLVFTNTAREEQKAKLMRLLEDTKRRISTPRLITLLDNGLSNTRYFISILKVLRQDVMKEEVVKRVDLVLSKAKSYVLDFEDWIGVLEVLNDLTRGEKMELFVASLCRRVSEAAPKSFSYFAKKLLSRMHHDEKVRKIITDCLKTFMLVLPPEHTAGLFALVNNEGRSEDRVKYLKTWAKKEGLSRGVGQIIDNSFYDLFKDGVSEESLINPLVEMLKVIPKQKCLQDLFLFPKNCPKYASLFPDEPSKSTLQELKPFILQIMKNELYSQDILRIPTPSFLSRIDGKQTPLYLLICDVVGYIMVDSFFDAGENMRDSKQALTKLISWLDDKFVKKQWRSDPKVTYKPLTLSIFRRGLYHLYKILRIVILDPPNTSLNVFRLLDFPSRHELRIDDYKAYLQEIQETTKTIIFDLQSGKTPFSTIQAAHENVDEINNFLKGLDSNFHLNLYGTLKDFQIAESELQVYMRMADWFLKNVQFDGNEDLGDLLSNKEMKNMNLEQVKRLAVDLKDEFALDPTTFGILKFFIGERDSRLFDEVIRGYLPLHDQADSRQIAQSTEKAVQYLRRIIEAEDLRDLKLIQTLLERYRESTLVGELDTLSKFFGQQTAQDTTKRVDRFKQGVKLVVYEPSLRLLIRILWEWDNLEREGIKEIENICDRVSYTYNLHPHQVADSNRVVTYAQAPELLRKLQGALYGLDTFHLEYFKVVWKAGGLIDFFQHTQRDFAGKIALLRARMGGMGFYEKMLDNLTVSREYLNLCIEKQHFRKMADYLKTRFTKENEMQRLKAIEFSVEHLPKIRLMFNTMSSLSAEAVIPKIDAFDNSGWFESKLEDRNSKEKGLSVHFVFDKHENKLALDNLDDLIRGAIFTTTDKGGNKSRLQKVENFLQKWELASAIHEIRSNLAMKGHPKFQHGPRERLIQEGQKTSTIEYLKNSKKNYQILLDEWEKNQRACLDNNQRLLLLSNNQLLSLIEQMETIKSQGDERDEVICFESLFPYVKLCFTDIPQEEFTAQLLLKFLDEAQEEENLLQRVSHFVGSIAKHFPLEDEEEHEGQSNMKVVRLSDPMGMELLGVLFELFNMETMPSVEEILWCSESLSKRDIQIFMRRTTHFPEKRFVIMGVNKLTNSLREELLKFQIRVLNDQIETAETFLIFTNSIGTEMFTFLANFRPDGVAYQNLKPSLAGLKRLESMNISQLEYVTGLPRNGKTMYIQRKMEEACEYTVICSVNEDWEGLFLLNKIDAMGFLSGVVGIYFKLSEHAPLPIFDRFLFHLIFGGILVDEESGVLRRLNPSVEWKIFVEIPLVEMVDDFPLLKIFGNEVRVDDFPFIVGDKLREVCAFLELYNSRELESAKLDQVAKLQDDQKCRELLADVIEKKCQKVGRLKFQQAIFVKLLWTRVNWIQRVFVNNTQLLEAGNAPSNFIRQGSKHVKVKDWYHSLFSLFLEECNNYCDEELKGNWSSFGSYFCLGDKDVKDWAIFQFSALQKVNPLTRIFSEKVMDGQKAQECRGELRAALAPALGMYTGASRMLDIFMNEKYVLTPDFALKMLILNERRISGANVIIQGGTGVGKTELLRVYSLLLNAGPSVLPDLRFEIQQWANKFLPEDMKIDIHKRLSAATIIEHVQKYIGTIEEEEQQKIITGAVELAREILNGFPLLVPSQLISALLDEDAENPEPEQIGDILHDISTMQPRAFFHKILMHSELSAQDFRSQILDIDKQTRDIAQKMPDLRAIVFIDEMNTSSILGMVKEVFVDNTLDGNPLSENIFWVGAINPFNKEVADQTKGITGQGGNFDEDQPDFVVRRLLKSMEKYVMDYKRLTEGQEKEFLDILFNEELFGHQCAAFRNMAVKAQRFVVNAQIKRVHPSLRDLVRMRDLMAFFCKNGKHIFDNCPHVKWGSFLMAVAINYYFRLPTLYKDRNLRREFRDMIQREMNRRFSPILDFEEFTNKQLQHLFKEIQIPVGIANTQQLLENLYSIVICTETNIPLQITGPPGSSKTLSYNLASSKMKGRQSESNFLKQFKNVHRFHYQCSEHSTAKEIKGIFESAISSFKHYCNAQMLREACSVFLDEGGLPTERQHAMKVIHFYLDHPKVAVCILTNTTLDAAKTNRTIQVFQQEPSEQDLKTLAKGCLATPGSNQGVNRVIEMIVEGCCIAFKQINDLVREWREDLFHLRDFVYFLRYLRKHGKDHASDQYIDAKQILKGILRNFNGVPAHISSKIVTLFFNEIKSAGRRYRDSHYADFDPSRYKISTLDLIKSSVEDKVDDNEDPNQAAFRYSLIIDPTDCQSAISLLFDMGVINRDEAHICNVSDFVGDDNFVAQSHLVSEIKGWMEIGKKVILLNSGPIQSSFYDVFNRHFTSVMGPNDKPQHYANVAIGSYSRPCQVHPDFKIIIHLPQSELGTTALPFLNRFEKFVLNSNDVIQEIAPQLKKPIPTLLKSIKYGVEHFVEWAHPSTFYGFVQDETVDSLLLSIIKATKKTNHNIPLIPPSFTIGGVTSSTTEGEGGFEDEDPLKQQRKFIRRASFRLLHLCRPESVYLQRHKLPKEYLVEYLLRQEHFSIIRFFSRLFNPYFYPAEERKYSDKWFIFTRSSREMFRLHTSNIIQNLVAKIVQDKKGLDAKKVLKLVSLGSIKTSKECEEEIDDFYSSEDQRILICLADLRIVTTNQINFARDQVNKYDSRKEKEMFPKCVVFLLHFPPEWLVLNHQYDSVFLDSWDAIYIDSLGVIQTTKTSETIQNEEVVEAADVRKWISVAFGLERRITSEELGNEFADQMKRAIEGCLQKMIIETPSAESVKLSGPAFYRGGKRGKREKLNELMGENGVLHKCILDIFGAMWDSKYLDKVIQEACEAIQLGQSVMSLLEIIPSYFEFLLNYICAQIVGYLSRDLGMETIMRIEKMEQHKRQLYTKLLIFAVQAINFHIPEDDVNLGNVLNVKYPNVSHSHYKCFNIPLYGLLNSRINTLKQKALLNMKPEEKQIDNILKELKRRADKDSISKMIKLIEENRDLLFHPFKEDFLRNTLGVSSLTPIEKKVYLAWIGLHAKEDNIVGVFLTVGEKGAALGYLSSLLPPLSEYSSEPTQDFMRKLEECRSDTAFIQLVSSTTIEALWKEFEFLFTNVPEEDDDSDDNSDSESDEEEEEYDERLENFLSHLRQFTSNIVRVVTMNQLDRTLQTKLDILAFYEKYHLSIEKNPIPSMRDFSRFQKVHPTLIEEYKGLEDILQFMDELWIKIEGSQLKDALSLQIWLEDLLFFLYYPYKNKISGKERRELLTPLEKETYDQLPADRLKNELSVLISFLGKTEGLATMLDEKVKARLLFSLFSVTKWERYIMNLVGKEIVSKLKEGEEYQYHPPWSAKRAQDGRVYHFFEDIYYQIQMRNLLSKLNSPDPPTLGQIIGEMGELRVEGEMVSRVLITIQRVCLLLQCFHKAAKLIGEAANPVDEIKGWEAETKNQLKKVLTTGTKEERQCFFLKLIPENKLNKILQDGEVLKSIGLEEWLVEGEIKEAPYHLLPFIFNDSNEGKEYVAIEKLISEGNAATLTQKVDEILANDPEKSRYRLRMYILLICYFHYYNELKACPIMIEMLDDDTFVQKLKITPDEMLFYKRFANEPPKGNEKEELFWTFSYQVVENGLYDDRRHLFVNILAVTLGLPPNSNHLHTRIFNTPYLLKGVRGPGSSGRTQQDCGYQMYDNFQLPGGAVKLGQLFTYANNYFTWAAHAISLFNPKNIKHIEKICYHGNFERFVPIAGLNRNQKLQKYVLRRPAQFFLAMTCDANLQTSNLNPILFMNQALYRLWQTVIEGDPRAKGEYPTLADTDNYELMLKEKVFDPIMNKKAEIKEMYDKMLKMGENLQKISTMRRDPRLQFNAIFPPYDFFLKEIGNFDTHPVLKFFTEHRRRMKVVKHLPFLVSYYRWIHHTFNHMFTREQAMNMTITQALDVLPNAHKHRVEFEKLKTIWKELQDTLLIVGCANQGGDAVGPEIPDLGNDFLFGELVTHDLQDTREHDKLWFTLNELTNLHQEVVQKGISTKNPFWVTFEIAQIQLQFLPHDMHAHHLLAMGDIEGDFEEYVTSHIDITIKGNETQIQISPKLIEREILERYITGRVELERGSLREQFIFKEENAQDMDAQTGENRLGEMRLAPIKMFLNKIELIPDHCNVPNNDIRPMIQGRQEKDIIELITFLSTVIDLLHESDLFSKTDTILRDLRLQFKPDSYIPRLHRNILKKTKVQEMKWFCNLVIEKYLERENLFCGLGDGVGIALPPTLRTQLEDTFIEIMNHEEEMKKHLITLQTIASVLIEKERQRLVRNSTDKSMQLLFRKTLLEKGVDDGDIRDFLPEQCKCENYAYYMRLLHKACGQIMLKIHQQAEDEEVYVEKVLEAFEGEQNEGMDQDPEVINFEENTKEEEVDITFIWNEKEMNINIDSRKSVEAMKDIIIKEMELPTSIQKGHIILMNGESLIAPKQKVGKILQTGDLVTITLHDPTQGAHLTMEGYLKNRRLSGVDMLKDRLIHHGFQYDQRILGDGHCQFRSLAHQLFGKIQNEQVELLRKEVAKWILQNGRSYIIENGARLYDFFDEGVDEYCRKIESMQMAVWGGHISLLAISEIYQTCIWIISSIDGPEYLVKINSKYESQCILRLCHWHEYHYSSLIPAADEKKEIPEIVEEKGKITVQFVGENIPPIEYTFEPNETIQDLLSAPSINPNSLHLLAFLDATSNHMPLSGRCPLKKVQDDIIFILMETTLLIINQEGKLEQPVHYERNLVLRELLAHYRKTTAFIVPEGGSATATRIKDNNILVWDLGLKDGMKLAIMGDATVVDSDNANKTPEEQKQSAPTPKPEAKDAPEVPQPEPEKDETPPKLIIPRPSTDQKEGEETPKIITPTTTPPESKKDPESQGTSESSGVEPTLYLSTSSNPGSTENIEFGEQDTVQTLLDEEEFNPDGIFSAFLDPEGSSGPLDPETPLSQLQDKQLYFLVPPEEEEPSVLLTSSIMDPGESETIEFGDDDTIQTLLDEEEYNPDGNMIAYLDPEGKGEPLDPKTPLSDLKNKQIYFLPPPGIKVIVIDEPEKGISLPLSGNVTISQVREAVAAELKTKVGCIDVAMEKGKEGKILLSRMLDKFPYQVVFGDAMIWVQNGKEKENPKVPFEYDDKKKYEEMIYSFAKEGEKYFVLVSGLLKKDFLTRLVGNDKVKVSRCEKTGEKVKTATIMGSKFRKGVKLVPSTSEKFVYYWLR